MTGSRLLTEPEAAERLRCSTSKIKRLRLAGKLPYIAGRPVLIEEVDLDGYLESAKRRAKPGPAPNPSGTRGAADARQWALQATVLSHRAPTRRKPK